MLPEVAIGSLGGTITMTDRGAGGVTPTLGADDLIASVPDLATTARVGTRTLASLPGASLALDDVLGALRWADDEVGRGAAGVVLVQGTDTIEETAYLLDLHWHRPEPLVVTGAMRPPTTAGADGPANLLAAVRVAVAPACRGRGVLVVMNDEVHAAARVAKQHASAADAFVSPVFGPVAVVVEGRPVVGNDVDRAAPLATPEPGSGARVAVVTAGLGEDGTLLEAAYAAGYDGVVVAAFGVGHVGGELAAAVGDVLGRSRPFPVVVASGTGSGTTFHGTYGFPGSESDLIARGALPAGWLGVRKARILLWALLAAGADPATVREEFDRRGGLRAGLRCS